METVNENENVTPEVERCRCCGNRFNGWDHCNHCGCEEFEERCEWENGQSFQERHPDGVSEHFVNEGFEYGVDCSCFDCMNAKEGKA